MMNLFENINENDIKFELRNLNYEELLNKTAQQEIIIKEVESIFDDNLTIKEMLESLEIYAKENQFLNKEIVLKYIEEIKKI